MSLQRLCAGATAWAVAPLVLMAAAPSASAGGNVLHVPAQFSTIQQAVNAAAPGDTVLVADGTYTGPGNRDVDMQGKQLVIQSQGGPDRCAIDCEGSPEDPHRAFLFHSGEGRAARIEGFTIRGGATQPGAIADPFNGGAIQIVDSSPTISDCVFESNSCGCWGGAVYSGGLSEPLIERCLFVGNSAGDDGGALFCWSGSAPVVRNCVFVGNDAPAQGGAIANFGWSQRPLRLEYVTITGNQSANGSGVAAWGPTDVRNSIIWGNVGSSTQITNGSTTEIEYSNIEGGFLGKGNLDVLPGFAKDGFHLAGGSPCIDAGEPGIPESPFDFDGAPRLVGARVDMGADELVGLVARR